jgi:hypothetical protein
MTAAAGARVEALATVDRFSHVTKCRSTEVDSPTGVLSMTIVGTFTCAATRFPKERLRNRAPRKRG